MEECGEYFYAEHKVCQPCNDNCELCINITHCNGCAENFTLNVSGQAVPEPGEYAAMGSLALGLGGLILRRRKRA